MTTSTVTANENLRRPGLADDKLSFASGVSRQAGDTRSRPGTYALPHDVAQRLGTALAGYKNQAAAHALALFLARFWSSRAKMVRPFPVDRRALADRDDLGLTESRIRGALRVLEEIGFLNRGIPPAGSAYKPTPEGLHRKPITFGFGSEYGPLFAAANARAERARARREGRAVQVAKSVTRSVRMPVSRPEPISPKDKFLSGSVVIMGEVARGFRKEGRIGRCDGLSPFEDALARFLEAGRSHGTYPR